MRIKKLTECELNKEYVIYEINIKEKNLLQHLDNLFIKKNQKIKLMFKSYKGNSFIIKSLGINYALDKNICENIIVYVA